MKRFAYVVLGGALLAGLYWILTERSVSDAAPPQSRTTNGQAEVVRRPYRGPQKMSSRSVTRADRIHWDGEAWAVEDNDAVQSAAEQPLDVSAIFEEEPAKWLDTEVWLNTTPFDFESYFRCHKAARTMTVSCKIRYTLVGRKGEERNGQIVHVEPNVLEGADDSLCQELAECLAHTYLRASIPLPEEGDEYIGFTREEILHPSAGVSREARRQRLEDVEAGLQMTLAGLRDESRPQDPTWQREVRVVERALEKVVWLLDRM